MQLLPDSDSDPLRAQLDHAERLARVLATLYDGALPGDPARLWLTGRSAEIGVFVADVRDARSKGTFTTVRARDSIARYLRSLHRSLESWYGPRYTPSCCSALESSVRAVRPGARKSEMDPSLPESFVRACSRANQHGSLPRDTLPEGTPGVGAYRVMMASSSG